MEDRGRIFFWIVVAVASLLLLVRLVAPPLADPDEARFARTSLEMMRSGDGERRALAFPENRFGDEDIGKVHSAVEGIVENEANTLFDIIAVFLE